jgi:hypothetical protein
MALAVFDELELLLWPCRLSREWRGFHEERLHVSGDVPQAQIPAQLTRNPNGGP